MSVQANICNLLQENPRTTIGVGAGVAIGSGAVLTGLLVGKGVSVLVAGVVGAAGIALTAASWIAIAGIVVGLAAVVFGVREANFVKLAEREIEQMPNDFSSRINWIADLVIREEKDPVAELVIDRLPYGDRLVANLFEEALDGDLVEGVLPDVQLIRHHCESRKALKIIFEKAVELLSEEGSEQCTAVRAYLEQELNHYRGRS